MSHTYDSLCFFRNVKWGIRRVYFSNFGGDLIFVKNNFSKKKSEKVTKSGEVHFRRGFTEELLPAPQTYAVTFFRTYSKIKMVI